VQGFLNRRFFYEHDSIRTGLLFLQSDKG
jgi:hypothetical protein